MTNSRSGNKNYSGKTLKRIEFEFNGSTFKFLLNPETYEQVETNRMNITHTKAGAFIETFGANIVEISISGVTGLRNNTSNTESGYKHFKALRDLIKSVYDNVTDGQEITKFLNFYNFTDNEYYETYPDKFTLSRSKSQPLLYKYSIHLYCLRKLGTPKKAPLSLTGFLEAENTVLSTLGLVFLEHSSNAQMYMNIWDKYYGIYDKYSEIYKDVKEGVELLENFDIKNYKTYAKYFEEMSNKYWKS